MGRTLIEGIMLGKPIIYPNIPGLKDFYTDGVHGLAYTPGDYIDLVDKILLTVNHPEETRKRIRTAKAYIAETLTDANYSGKIYETLMKTRGVKHSTTNALFDLFGKNVFSHSKQEFESKLYFSDTADNFSENQSTLSEKIKFGYFHIKFELPHDGYMHVRLDPIEGHFIDFKLFKMITITPDGTRTTYSDFASHSNAYECTSNTWTFCDFDPQLVFDFYCNIEKIEFFGEIKHIPLEEGIDILNNVILPEKNNLIQQHTQSIQAMKTSASWRITRPLRAIRNYPAISRWIRSFLW